MNNRMVEDNNLQSDLEDSEMSDIDEVDITNNNNYLILSSFLEDNNGINLVDRLNSFNNTHKRNNNILNELNNNICKLLKLYELQTKTLIEANNLKKEELERDRLDRENYAKQQQLEYSNNMEEQNVDNREVLDNVVLDQERLEQERLHKLRLEKQKVEKMKSENRERRKKSSSSKKSRKSKTSKSSQ